MAKNIRVFSSLTEYQNAELQRPSLSYVTEIDPSTFAPYGTFYDPTIPPKFLASYSDGKELEVLCNSSNFLTSSETKPSSYTASAMTDAKIGTCVKTLGASCLQNCYSLSSVTFTSNLEVVGDGAFMNCEGLTSVELPKNVTYVGVQAFRNCTGLTSVEIPSGVTSIGAQAFYNCKSLSSITLPNITSLEQAVLQYCEGLTSIVIPSSVTNIKMYALDGCSGLTSITVEATTPPTLAPFALNNTNNCTIYVPEESVDTYKAASGWSSFAERIQAIPLKFKATYVGGSTYGTACDGSGYISQTEVESGPIGTQFITSVDIRECTTKLAGFSNCTSLSSVTMTDNVTIIDSFAFRYCNHLSSITISSGTTQIGRSAFQNCTNLRRLNSDQDGVFNFPESTVAIAQDAFKNCTMLETVNTSNSLQMVGGFASTNIRKMNSNTNGYIVIPSSARTIEAVAFQGCTGISTVEISTSTKQLTILTSAFQNCRFLSTIRLNTPYPPTLSGNGIFANTPIASGQGIIYVPSSAVNTYKTASGWSQYANIIVGI